MHLDAALVRELDLPRAAALHELRSEMAGALEQNGIEARAADLVGVAERFVPALREVEALRALMGGGEELRAVLGEADGRDLGGDSEPLEQRQTRRQQRLADVEAGMMGLLEQHHAVTGVGEKRRRRRAAGAATDDDDVDLRVLRSWRFCHLAVNARPSPLPAGSR